MSLYTMVEHKNSAYCIVFDFLRLFIFLSQCLTTYLLAVFFTTFFTGAATF
jgi:hypothetical protein